MSGRARFERKKLDEFLNCWEDLFEQFPEARAKAVESMGEAMQKEVNARIQAADLESDAKGTVVAWQELRLGSGGGYAVVSPIKGQTVLSRDRRRSGVTSRQHTYRGDPVTSKQITNWLEKGHGAREADTQKAYAWSDYRWNRMEAGNSSVHDRTGKRYIPGRQFYSFARLHALELALKAADKVLAVIADEVDY